MPGKIEVVERPCERKVRDFMVHFAKNMPF